MPVNPLLGALGLTLVFFLPGFAVSRSLFPEWNLTGRGSSAKILETLSLSLVVSVALTIVVGFGLLSLGPSGFQASWSDPELEAVLGAITAIGLVTAFLRGGFHRGVPSPEAERSEDPLRLMTRIDSLDREARRLRRTLASNSTDAARRSVLIERLHEVEQESEALRRQREVEYAA